MGLFLFWALANARALDGFLPREPRVAEPRRCVDVDYRSQLGRPRVSGGGAYCFAYSSSHLLTQRSGVDASALDLATGFYLNKPNQFERGAGRVVAAELGPEFLARLPRETFRAGVDIDGRLPILPHLEGGFEASTLAWVNVRGVCPDANLPAEGGTDAYQKQTDRFLKIARGGRAKIGREVEGISARFRDPVADVYHAFWLRFTRARCRARRPRVPILPVDFALAPTSREFFRRRSDGEVGDEDQTRVLATLDFALDHGRVAAIGFDLNTVQTHEGYIDDDGDHSVAIVARRATATGCQYMVRDSAGYDCADFSPSVRRRCEGREYWLSEPELRRSLYSVTYLR